MSDTNYARPLKAIEIIVVIGFIIVIYGALAYYWVLEHLGLYSVEADGEWSRSGNESRGSQSS